MPKGKIVSVNEVEEYWTIFYKTTDGKKALTTLDWKRFAKLYEGSSGRSFQVDYDFGEGREKISNYFRGKIILTEGGFWDKKIRIED